MTICKDNNCSKNANFNFKNEKSALYCKTHSSPDMININSKKCLEDNCNTRPSFNFSDKKIALYCKTHAKTDMIDIKHIKCLEDNCNTRPSFNFSDKKIALYCKTHAKTDMIDIISKKCLEDNCNTFPVFNFPDKKITLYCKTHAKPGMIDIKNKKCLEDNCNTFPVFNLHNQTIGIYCKIHAKENMINVKDKTCLEDDCNTRPNFNFPDKKITLYCKTHAKPGMINIKNKKCLHCNEIQVTKKYNGYCLRCFIHLFPDVEISRNYKIKETHVTDFIKEKFKNEEIIFDKQVNNGCSRRRPDAYIDKLTHVIIIEVDEDQHRNYEEICSNKRSMELFQDFANRPIIFIKFNPDSYINEDNKKIESSFKIHKGFDVPQIRNKKEWTSRLKSLKKSIEKHLTIIPDKEVTIEHLYYDA